MQKWLDEIAPKYFDFDTSELYMTSQFGYMNEVMSTVENDTHHAVSIARREFYPNTANYMSSLYKMAALQKISYPLANPATATAILILRESDILTYGTDESNNVKSFVLDNSAVFYAASIPFMLDYPIKITVKSNLTNIASLASIKNAYTAKYFSDVNNKNSLSKSYDKYIKSRVYQKGAETLLLLKVTLRQCQITRYSRAINESPLISNISLDYNVGKFMCNFEAFYSEAYNNNPRQLVKIPVNSSPVRDPFCEWQMLDESNLRLSFPDNPYFTPRYNSELNVDVYTTMGDDGNFDRFDGPLTCVAKSERYPYNNAIKVSGKIVGSSIGGYSMPILDDFKNDVIAAYATNRTYTTDSDLQVMFDKTARTTRNRIIFSKRRDDCFERMYGAYTLLKDAGGYVIPTNSLTCEFVVDDTDSIGFMNGEDELIIKAGNVWRYHDRDPMATMNEPQFEVADTGEYTITTTAAGNIPNEWNEDDQEFRYVKVAYLTENDEPVLQKYPDGEYITTTDQYSYFRKDTNGTYVFDTSDVPMYLKYDSETQTYIQTDDDTDIDPDPEAFQHINQTITKENIPILDGGVPTGSYYIQDYGIIKKSLFVDDRNIVPASNDRPFMVYPVAGASIISTDTLTYDAVYQRLVDSFTYYLNVKNAGWPTATPVDYTYDDYLTAVATCQNNRIYDEQSVVEVAAEFAKNVYDTYAFTNPFLIRYNDKLGVSAYYRNTFNSVYPLELTFVEDANVLQFSTSGLTVTRNAIFGENFYKLTISIQPSVTGINMAELLGISDGSEETITAPFDGIVDRFVYIDADEPAGGSDTEQAYAGGVYMMIKYFVGDGRDMSPEDAIHYVDSQNVQDYIDAHYPNAYDEHVIIKALRVGSGIYYNATATDDKAFVTDQSYNTNLIAGSTIVAGNIIAIQKVSDTQAIRIIGLFKNHGEVETSFYVPFVYDSYDEINDSFNYSAYISTDDAISGNDRITLTNGVYNSKTASVDDGLSVDIENTALSIAIFTDFEGDNLAKVVADEDYPSRYNAMPYAKNYTLVNVYDTLEDSPVKFLELYRFIRSTSKLQTYETTRIDPDKLITVSTKNIYTEIREIPMVRAEWAASPGNIYDLFRLLKANHDWITEAYDLLDNNFTINMKLYNTYGRSRYLMIGNNYSDDTTSEMSTIKPLDSVMLRFRFGVKLKSLIDPYDFRNRFIAYVRSYIENFNSVENFGISIYMSDLYTKLNQKFKDEIVFLEFYGINNEDAQNSQIIKTWDYEDINALGYNKYIPEFINLITVKTDTIFVPDIELTFIGV